MDDTFLTITNKVGKGYYTEKRSRFLAFAHHVETVEEAKAIIDGYKTHYHDARHCCWAYVLGAARADFRLNDDGEPSSTAGKPIFGQIGSRNLTDVLVCVVRYYGGVNLGTGGLIVAYRTAASDALDDCEVVEQVLMEELTVTFNYTKMSSIMRIAKDMGAKVISQEYENGCKLTLRVRQSRLEELARRIGEVNY